MAKSRNDARQEQASVVLGETLSRSKSALADSGPDASKTFADAYEIVGNTPSAFMTSSGVESLLLVAQHFYVSLQVQQGLAPRTDAVTLARLIGDRPRLRKSLTFLGIMQAESGNLPAATANYADALDLARELGDGFAENTQWNDLGVALQYAARYSDAIRCYERAVALAGDDTSNSAPRGSRPRTLLMRVCFCRMCIVDVAR